jgi:transcriptional regulator with XRE-family HTH domain
MVKRHPRPPNSQLLTGFGARLRAAREAMGYNAANFARLLGITPQRLANWESDTNPPETYILAQLKHFGISSDYLLTGDMGNLTARLFQQLTNLGAGSGDPVAREVREAAGELPDPGIPPTRRALHERQAPPPRRFIHPPDIQQE